MMCLAKNESSPRQGMLFEINLKTEQSLPRFKGAVRFIRKNEEGIAC